MSNVCANLSFEDGSDNFEFLPTDFIKSYFADPKAGGF
jgi:hypothetical protein